MSKTLLLMRHAKSDWNADYGADHERPLNERGIRSARLMGRVLTSRGLIPGLIISSSAVRARTTAELVVSAGSWDSTIQLDHDLYELGPDGMIERLGKAPHVSSLMLVGHQPTWGVLAERLSGQPVEMKTATVAVISFDIDKWSEVSARPGKLAEVLKPRSYFGSNWDTG